MPEGNLWSLQRAYLFNATDPIYSGFVKSIGQDADGELYVVTGAFTPTGLIGRVFKIVHGSGTATSSPTPTDFCPALGCCEEDCCAEGTSWDNVSTCVKDPWSGGWDGTHTMDHSPECAYRICCEADCCGQGTWYDTDKQCCIPV